MYKENYPFITDEQYLTFLVCGIGWKDDQLTENRPDGFIYQIMITDSGEGRIISCGVESIVKAGDVFFFPADTPHFYEPVSEHWKVRWLSFSGSDIKNIISPLDVLDNTPVHFDDTGVLDSLFFQIQKLVAGKQKFYIQSCAPLIYAAIMEIFKAKHRINNKFSDTVEKITNYIHLHFDECITLDEMAELAGHSKQYICRLFQKELGIRPFEYVTQCRIQKAKQLLINTTLPVSEIGRLVGYEDKSYFGYIFRKYENKSPLQYKNS